MGFYMEGLILGGNTLYRFFCVFKLFLIGCIGLTTFPIVVGGGATPGNYRLGGEVGCRWEAWEHWLQQ